MTQINLRRVLVSALIISLLGISIMHAAPNRTPVASAQSLGYLKGRVVDAATGLGLVATLAVVGPISAARLSGGDGGYSWKLPYGTYSFTVLKAGYASQTRTTTVSGKWALEYFRLWPSQETTPPEPIPTTNTKPSPPLEGRVQRLATKVGFSQPALTSTNAQQFAERYDVIFGAIPASLVGTLRTTNPGIILMQYQLSGGEQSKSKYPDGYYVKDVSSRLRVADRNSFYLLNFADPFVRAARRDALTRNDVDGYWLDLASPEWVNDPYFLWHDEAGKVADVGELDGSWKPGMSTSTMIQYTDGTWPAQMLAFLTELQEAHPGKLIIFNQGFYTNPNRQSIWGSIQDKYLNVTGGGAVEFLFVVEAGPVAETLWKWQIDRVLTVSQSQKYVNIFVYRIWEAQNRLYGFASYLLVADGKYVWYNVFSDHYDGTLYAADYGAPLGAYQIVNTPTGPLYKREFSKATVWVNPGTVSRSADGKTVGPKSAIIEKVSN